LKPGEIKEFKETLQYPQYKETIDKAKYLKTEMNLKIDNVTINTPEIVEIQK
jgi:hypothetical protein